MTTDEFKNKYEEMKDTDIYKSYCSVLESKDLILRKLLKEKQELIDYLKERIKLCDKYIKIHKEELSGVVNVGENNRRLILIKNLTIKKEVYEEILSKIEKR